MHACTSTPGSHLGFGCAPSPLSEQASLIKQAFEALCVNEFEGSSFDPDAQGRGMTDGEQVGSPAACFLSMQV